MKKRNTKFLNAVVLFTQVGLNMAIPIILAVIAGNYLDKRLKTGIVFLILFLLIGIAAGFTANYRQLMIINCRKKYKD